MRRAFLILLLAACQDPAVTPSDQPESESESESETATESESAAAADESESHEREEEPAPPEVVRDYQCRVPAIPIPRPSECEDSAYPDCKWQLPSATLVDGRYRRWRNTIVEHHWGRPALVSLLLASLDAYHREVSDQAIAVGDLDAPGPRHMTHNRGVDVDVYALGSMRVENAGGGRYPSNFEGKSEQEIEELRRRVEILARVLATCANGHIRIYYNDDVVKERFHAWYDAQGFFPQGESSEFGRPMQGHNHLHDFHFHITIPEDLPLIEQEPLAAGETHPIAPIVAPPPPESAPNLSSMNRRPGGWGAVPREGVSASVNDGVTSNIAADATEEEPTE